MLTVENKPVDQMTSHGDVTSAVPRIELNFMNRYKDAYKNELEHFLDVIEGRNYKHTKTSDAWKTFL